MAVTHQVRPIRLISLDPYPLLDTTGSRYGEIAVFRSNQDTFLRMQQDKQAHPVTIF